MKARGFSTLFYHVQVLGGERDVLIWIKQLWKSPRIQNHMINLIALLPQQKPLTILLKTGQTSGVSKGATAVNTNDLLYISLS